MRIVVWNAHMAFARKQDHLLKLKPDVAVIPECESDIGAAAGCWSWVGDRLNRSKGLGVVSYGHYRVSAITPVHDPNLRWAAPIAVRGPHAFFLLAIWAHRPYLGNVHKALEAYRHHLTPGPAVVAGDFNYINHRNLKLLEELGLVSAYHHHFKEDFLFEKTSTHYWRYKTDTTNTYHYDYCFLPKLWIKRLKSVRLGTASKWIDSRLSDHIPIVSDVRMT